MNDMEASAKTPALNDRCGRWVDIEFDCLPLRSVPRVDVPMDASLKLAEKMLRVKAAIEQHGSLNTYYLHNAKCVYHLTNDPFSGMLEFAFEGVVFTDQLDVEARKCVLTIDLVKETCEWLNQGIVDWMRETVQNAVLVEFNRYIQAGDLSKAIERIEQLQQESERSGGFVGMYL